SAARGRTRPPAAAARSGRTAGRSGRPPPSTRPPTPPPGPPSAVLPSPTLAGTPCESYCTNYGCRTIQLGRRDAGGAAVVVEHNAGPEVSMRAEGVGRDDEPG